MKQSCGDTSPWRNESVYHRGWGRQFDHFCRRICSSQDTGDNVDVQTVIARQTSYSHIGFIFTRSALETYLGRAASLQIRDLIMRKGDSRNTVGRVGPCGHGLSGRSGRLWIP
jgi:hypothetical protein